MVATRSDSRTDSATIGRGETKYSSADNSRAVAIATGKQYVAAVRTTAARRPKVHCRQGEEELRRRVPSLRERKPEAYLRLQRAREQMDKRP